MHQLTQDEQDALDRDGYVLRRDVFTRDEVDAMVDNLADVFDHDRDEVHQALAPVVDDLVRQKALRLEQV